MSTVYSFANTNAAGDPPYATFKFDNNTTPTTITFNNTDVNDNVLFPIDTHFGYTGDILSEILIDIVSPMGVLVGTFLLDLSSKFISGSTTRYNVTNYILNDVSSSVISPGTYYNFFIRFRRAPYKRANVKYVGALGDFTTLKAAVDWFNTTATTDITLRLDSGIFLITDTISVNAGDRSLTINGEDTNNTYFHAATGLAGKPMFNIRSACDIHRVNVDGTTLAGYGAAGAGENFVTFDTLPTTSDNSVYCEFVDIIITGFSIAISDTIGATFFVFNFIIDTCPIGVLTNYSRTGAGETSIDCEVGNFVNCAVGVSLAKAELASFILSHLVFYIVNTTDIGVLYDGTNYTYGTSSVLLNSSYNHVGILTSGFNFAIQRDANIEISDNVGIEDAIPYAKINVRNSIATITETNANQYYRATFTNGTVISLKIGLTDNRMTYLSSHARSMKHWISGNLSTSGANRTIDVALRRELALTALTVSGLAVTGTSASAHHLVVGDQVQILGVTGGTVTWNGVKTIASVPTSTTFTYASTGTGTASGYNSSGACGIIYSPMSVRTGTSTVAVSFSLVAFIPLLGLNDYVEIWVLSSNALEVTTLVDITWLSNSQ